MLFSSPRFFVFVAILLLLLAPRWRLSVKLNVLLIASCLFYAAWDWRYLGLLAGVSAINYVCGASIHAAPTPRARRAWLTLSLVASLGTLGWFKYANFFIENANRVLEPLGSALPELAILLPAGISFYTFKTMSYTIDIYRRELEPSPSWMHYSTFVTFFPELIAGPIVRASVFLPQMDRDIGPTRERLATGGSLFLLGLTKKIVLADHLSAVVDPVFATPGLYSAATVWIAVFAYSFQIYCDFSGYSDMAVGTAKAIGYDLPRNFRMPYLSANVTEFWRRWHITLSTWLRDYLYVPLGGNRHGSSRTYLNLMLTMLLGGLWHGASWNFVAWGGLHGLALAVHRAIGRDAARAWPAVVSAPLTFLFVTLCWIPFRATDFENTRTVLGRLVAFDGSGVVWVPATFLAAVPLLALGHALGAVVDGAVERNAVSPRLARWMRRFDADVVRDPIAGWVVRPGSGTIPGSMLLTGWILAILAFASTGASPFIYFQF